MPKSRKRRTARPRDLRKNLRRRLATPLREPRPKHPSYEQVCPGDVLIDEFGEEGAAWLQEEYGQPLTLAEFSLEHSIRTDEFLLDDPFTGPEATTAEEISKVIEMTADVILAMAEQQGVLNAGQAREVADIKAMPPVDHAAEGIDVVRIAFETGRIFLNDRGMWDFGE
ncbi:hypothetical protein ACIO6T_37200 [Streptomyces sp. NPDC087532]|uniref:hypothetical protein n=1 Tax=unclassified Streptomyces TaxID=2593676 RepID=UPI0033240E8C